MQGLNHLFQMAVRGRPSQYSSISETFPAAPALIGEWLNQRLGHLATR